MNLDLILGILQIVLIATTPLVFAGIGELVTEKSGVLNLGVEGMMLVGAVSAFIILVITGSYFLAFFVSILSGIIMSGLFAFLVLFLMSNQIATGLALTIFGIGLSSMLGKQYIGTPIDGLSPWFFVIFSFLIVFLVSYFFYKTKAGLILRAVGESHNSAHALGYSVIKIRFLSIIFGGSMCALAGSYISICYAPMWQEGMTAGRGWDSVSFSCICNLETRKSAYWSLYIWRCYYSSNESSGFRFKISWSIFQYGAICCNYYSFSVNF